MMNALRAIGMSVVFAVAAASCGGGASAGSGGGADWRKAANALCASADAKIDGLDEPEDYQGVATLMNAMGTVVKEIGDSMRALTAPPEHAADFRSYLAALDDLVALARQAEEAASANDEEGYAAIDKQMAEVAQRMNSLARTMKLGECISEE